VRVLELEGGLDPDEDVREAGAEVYRQKVAQAPGYFDWLADRARQRFDMRTAQGRVSALQFLLPSVQRISDKLERATIASDLAGYLGVEAGLVLDHFKKAATHRGEQPLAAVQEPIRAVEKILLNSLLIRDQIRAEIIPPLRVMSQVEHFAAGRIFQAIFALYDSRPDFRFPELEGRLGDSDKTLLASVIFADELREEDYTLEQALACLRRLETETHESQRAALRTRVKEAERGGDFAEALRVAQELSRLEKLRG